MKKLIHIAVLLAVAATAALPRAMAEGDAPELNTPPMGSIARQLLLAAKLKRANHEAVSLAAAMDHNRADWEKLSPDQRNKFRQEALAFLNENPQEQERLLQQYDKLISMSAAKQAKYRQTAEWLKVVTASFTPEERKTLLALTPEQRAKALLERKAQLIKEGKLPAETPKSAPATEATSAASQPTE
jgi:hypothetical protein